jgi:hypothetical protein
MDLPEPEVSDDLVEYLDSRALASEGWQGIAAALLERERAMSDLQAGWLMTAFEYGLARRVRENRAGAAAFGEKFSGERFSYPTPIGEVPEEVIDLWTSAAERVATPGPRARLHHLLFERGSGNKGTHGREAAAAYLALGVGTWPRLERVNCLHWARDLSMRVGDVSEAAKVIPALVALAIESLDQEKREPGVALHALEVLAYEDADNPDLPQLLERARGAYDTHPYLTTQTIRIQEEVFKSDPARRAQLRRETVLAFYAHAMTFPPGALRMSFLENAATLAEQYGFADLSDQSVEAMQRMTLEDMDLKPFSATASIPTEIVDAHVASMLERPSFGDVLEALAAGEAPTGNVDRNRTATQQIAEQTPLASLMPTKHLGDDGLPRYMAASDEDRIDEQLARAEVIALGLAGRVTARILDEALAKFTPSHEEIVPRLQKLSHVSIPVARSIAVALLDFQAGRYEEAATVAMPRVESLARSLCQGKNVLRLRVQRYQKQGSSTRGQYPQLGALLVLLRPWMDPSWDRFLWTFLVSPFGPQFRHNLLHGFTEEVTPAYAALTLLAALRLAIIAVAAGIAPDGSGADESRIDPESEG